MADDQELISSMAARFEMQEDEVKDLLRQYKEADGDNSGAIDREELKNLLRKTLPGNIPTKNLNAFLESQWENIDNDNSGAMDFAEFLDLYNICFRNSQAAKKEKETTEQTNGDEDVMYNLQVNPNESKDTDSEQVFQISGTVTSTTETESNGSETPKKKI